MERRVAADTCEELRIVGAPDDLGTSKHLEARSVRVSA
jgi:hypothetical protein